MIFEICVNQFHTLALYFDVNVCMIMYALAPSDLVRKCRSKQLFDFHVLVKNHILQNRGTSRTHVYDFQKLVKKGLCQTVEQNNRWIRGIAVIQCFIDSSIR